MSSRGFPRRRTAEQYPRSRGPGGKGRRRGEKSVVIVLTYWRGLQSGPRRETRRKILHKLGVLGEMIKGEEREVNRH